MNLFEIFYQPRLNHKYLDEIKTSIIYLQTNTLLINPYIVVLEPFNDQHHMLYENIVFASFNSKFLIVTNVYVWMRF